MYLLREILSVCMFVRSEKINQISTIRHYSLKNKAFQSYYSHSCFRSRHFAPLYPASMMNLLNPRSTTCLCLFTYQKRMVEWRHDKASWDSQPYRGIMYCSLSRCSCQNGEAVAERLVNKLLTRPRLKLSSVNWLDLPLVSEWFATNIWKSRNFGSAQINKINKIKKS